MIVIENVLISEDVVEQQFVCDLNKCKGGCCEVGDAGAPLENEELEIIKDVYEKVKPYLSEASQNEIEKKNVFVYDREFGWVTPTLDLDNAICAYGIREKNGMIKCAFEQAYYDGAISWKKPISCHLFPIIAKKGKHGDYDRVNYQPKENLCNPGCDLGKKLKTPVYKFLKEALIRKFGEDFYNTLDKIAQDHFKNVD